MNDSKISVRYAKALFESASEKKVLDEVRRDMDEIQTICRLPEFQYLVTTPVMKESQKCDVINTILGKSIHPLSLSLLNLVFQNGRELFIEAIARNYVDFYKKSMGIKTATFTTAAPMPDSMHLQVKKIIEETLNSTVELKTEQKEELIGGFIIRLDNQQYDASVLSSLKSVRKQLLK